MGSLSFGKHERDGELSLGLMPKSGRFHII